MQLYENSERHRNDSSSFQLKLEEILQIYEKSLEIDPQNQVNLTNYCGFLLEHWSEDKQKCATAFRHLDTLLFSEDFLSKEPSLALECWFLVLVFYPSYKISEALENIKCCLLKGGRSVGWDFSNHLRFAKSKKEKGKPVFPDRPNKTHHIAFPFLAELTKTITG